MKKISTDAKIAVIGGDGRMLYCAKKIAEKGYETAIFGFDSYDKNVEECTRCKNIDDAVLKSSIVILPMPVSTDSITLNAPFSDASITLPSLFSVIPDDTVVFGANVSEQTAKLAKKFGIEIIDYFQREELKIANAVLTAESAIEIAMKETDASITDEPVLVVGYGRIGKALCRALKALGCEVFASARKDSDKAWIRAFGYSPVDTGKIDEYIGKCKIIFNTVPYMVLGENELSKVNKESLIIDLASKPGGVDFEKAKGEKLRVIWALALPGKMMKESAGKIISDTIFNILEEENLTE